jgi:hypothetical protein
MTHDDIAKIVADLRRIREEEYCIGNGKYFKDGDVLLNAARVIEALAAPPSEKEIDEACGLVGVKMSAYVHHVEPGFVFASVQSRLLANAQEFLTFRLKSIKL